MSSHTTLGIHIYWHRHYLPFPVISSRKVVHKEYNLTGLRLYRITVNKNQRNHPDSDCHRYPSDPALIPESRFDSHNYLPEDSLHTYR